MIPALDEAGRIEAAIRSARCARPEPTLEPNSEPNPTAVIDPDVEVLVVDGGSRDDTVARARAAGAAVIESERGRARQLRAGVAAATGDAVLMLHADTRLPPGWKPAVEAALADAGVVAGAFALRFDEPGLGAVEWGARVRSQWWQLPYGDQALFARRSALEAVGGVPLAPVMEDVDLVEALRREGRIALLPLSVSTSGRRYLERGAVRVVLLHFLALMARACGVDRARIARWLGR